VSSVRKGLLLGAVQLALVLSLGGKLLYDRVTRPRVWVLSAIYDPDLPIRGRYLSERLQFSTEGFTYTKPDNRNSNEWFVNRQWAYLEVRNGQLFGKQQGHGPGQWVHLHQNTDGTLVGLSEEPVLFFIPDQAVIPILKAGEQMWVEVTIPAKGPPRPIRIGIRRDGVLTPLKLN
jgi:hypothetical protein